MQNLYESIRAFRFRWGKGIAFLTVVFISFSLTLGFLVGAGKAEGVSGPGTGSKDTEARRDQDTQRKVRTAEAKDLKSDSFPLEMKDSYERLVRLPSSPKRIVSCAPNMTEIVFYLGEGNRLVGRTDWCNWPEEAKKIPSVGGLQDPNIERIIQLKPELVLASSHFQKETVELLESVGIPVYVGLANRDYEEVYGLIRSVGLLLGVLDVADRKVKAMKEQIERIRRITAAISYKPTVYYMISFGDEGDYTAGSDTHVAQLIRWAGGRNVGDRIKGWRFSIEGLLKEDPDILLVRKGGNIPEQLKRLPPYKDLRAVRLGKVYEMDIDLIDRMGPRNVEGLRQLMRIIHPEQSIP
ncbi:MAG: ABC transporter substrate-binding protein [Spirochaetes bacterium]|nr:ABC transporter substrate-binding protein [Spirochaetota bacterium]